MTTDYTNLYRH